jgi:hypothetical protein
LTVATESVYFLAARTEFIRGKKRLAIFPLFPATRERLVSDIPAGEGKIANLFTVYVATFFGEYLKILAIQLHFLGGA